MDQFKSYLQYQKEVAEAKLKIICRFQKGVKTRSLKRTSKINVAWHVLSKAGRPLHVSEIIKISKHDFQVDLERDSIVSGIIKKVKTSKTFDNRKGNLFTTRFLPAPHLQLHSKSN